MRTGNSKKEHIITDILPGSIAEELQLVPGDVLLSINGEIIEDIFDYEFLIRESELLLLVRKQNNEEWELEIEKDEDEDLGICFEAGIMDEYRRCSNRCIFCFIDQMPPGMRETLYFKDDDSRLSFLQGNYVTLTNLTDANVDRIIKYRLSPMNISVHTTDPDLRCKMLGNRFAGKSLRIIDRFYEAGIVMNGQIVLCKNYNDKDALKKTLYDLLQYAPIMQSVSVVPVGLTKYRDNLTHLEPFNENDAIEVIRLIEEVQQVAYNKCGMHFVHASDEWYILANRDIPDEETYDDYPQLENGVGMIRLFENEFEDVLSILKERLENGRMNSLDYHRTVILATGTLFYPFLSDAMQRLNELFPQMDIKVKAITNNFFGKQITVAGLICGNDLITQLQGECNQADGLLIPVNMLRYNEDVFLDDVSIADVEDALQVSVYIVQSNPRSLVDCVLGVLEDE